MPVEVTAVTDKGGCAKLGKHVTCSYAVASVADFPAPEICYTWVTLNDGRDVSLFVNRENNLIVLDIVDQDGKGGCEVYRCELKPVPKKQSARNRHAREE